MFKEEIKNIKEGRTDLRKFGFTVGTMFLFIAIVLYFTGKTLFIYFGSIAVLLILLAAFYPEALKPVNKSWMILAIIMGWFMSRVILIILYYIILTPLALLLKITGKDFLKLKREKDITSYWEKRNKIKSEQIDYERQF